MTDQPEADPMEGQEITLLNSMLASLYKDAQGGDRDAIDRVLKILELKRKYREDRRQSQTERWKL